MAAFLDRVARERSPTAWLDATRYGERLLAEGALRWTNATAMTAWQRSLLALLSLDVAALPLELACSAWAAANPALRSAMGAKARALFPLRTLLADDALRTQLVELARGWRAAAGARPFALVAPSPAAWAACAHVLARGGASPLAIDADDADQAGSYVADLLRIFGEHGVDALLVDGTLGEPAAEPPGLAGLPPLLNVAAHYRWDAGVRIAGDRLEPAPPPGIGFAIAARAIAGMATGVAVPADYWRADAPPPPLPPGGFRFSEVPADTVPERVLAQRARLGAAPRA